MALPMLSTVMPQAKSARGSSTGQGQGFGPAGAGFSTNGNTAQGFGSLTIVEDDKADRDLSRGSGLSNRSNRSNNKSDTGGGSVSGSEVDVCVMRLGPWAVEALKPGGPGDKQPLLRQVVGDIASGRHPVTQ
jgi:hypothetical protein